jgi:hypothetical protein
MSTSDQVYGNYYYYVVCYIGSQLSQTPQYVVTQMYNATFSFVIVDNGDGTFGTTDWTVAGVTAPTISDLMAVDPSAPADYQLTERIVTVNLSYPDIGKLFVDIYSKISVLQGGSAYTEATLLTYLKTLLG